jgi:DNA-binding PadR family transcriptional regulator
MHRALFQILALLRDAPSDAASLLGGIEALTPKRGPSMPAFYRHLRRGIEEGWVGIDGTDPRDDGPGRPSQIYRLTPHGESALREHALELQIFTRLALSSQTGARK